MPVLGWCRPSAHRATRRFPVAIRSWGISSRCCCLEIPGIAARYGIGLKVDGSTVGGKHDWASYRAATATGKDLEGPLFWLAARLARIRERIGVHYRSDSLGSRRLAGGIWHAALRRQENLMCRR